MGSRWPHSCCFVGCCFQELFNEARSILVKFSSCFFSIRFFSVHVVHPFSSMDTTAARKKLRFILLDRSDFYIIDNLTLAVHVFTKHLLISLSVDEALLPRYGNMSTNLREPPFWIEISSSVLTYVYFVLFAFTLRSVPSATCTKLCMKDSAWVGVFARNPISSEHSVSVIDGAGYRLLLDFLVLSHFLSLDPSTSEVRSLRRLWTDMELKYHQAEYLKDHVEWSRSGSNNAFIWKGIKWPIPGAQNLWPCTIQNQTQQLSILITVEFVIK